MLKMLLIATHTHTEPFVDYSQKEEALISESTSNSTETGDLRFCPRKNLIGLKARDLCNLSRQLANATESRGKKLVFAISRAKSKSAQI